MDRSIAVEPWALQRRAAAISNSVVRLHYIQGCLANRVRHTYHGLLAWGTRGWQRSGQLTTFIQVLQQGSART